MDVRLRRFVEWALNVPAPSDGPPEPARGDDEEAPPQQENWRTRTQLGGGNEPHVFSGIGF